LPRLIVLIVIWCSINTLGEILLKIGAASLSEPNSLSGILRLLIEVIQNPIVLLGVGTCAIDLLLWIYILKNGELSVVAPLSAINYIFAAGAGWILFGETLSLNRSIGVLLICGGAFFISR
jgi:Predicted membrane protein